MLVFQLMDTEEGYNPVMLYILQSMVLGCERPAGSVTVKDTDCNAKVADSTASH